MMHHLTRIDESKAIPAEHALFGDALVQRLVDERHGSVHVGLSLVVIPSGSGVREHWHLYEQSVYVIEGAVRLRARAVQEELARGHAAYVPVETPHAWFNDRDEAARLVVVSSPQPKRRGSGEEDTFVHTAPAPRPDEEPLVVRGATPRGSTPRPSSISDAARRADGRVVSVLVDQPLGSHTMVSVAVQPGGGVLAHDHPFEQVFVMLEGECDFAFGGSTCTLAAGDVAWASVGEIHATRNRSARACRWLEAQAPAPPRRHAIRFVPFEPSEATSPDDGA